MKVWVGSHGGSYEGGYVEIVCDSFGKALEWLERCRAESEKSMEGMREHVRTWRSERCPERVPTEEEINNWRTEPIEVNANAETADMEDTSSWWTVRPWTVA